MLNRIATVLNRRVVIDFVPASNEEPNQTIARSRVIRSDLNPRYNCLIFD
jgi:hypothetical protein